MEGKDGKKLMQSPCAYKRVGGKTSVSRSNKENTPCPNVFLWDTSDDDDDDVFLVKTKTPGEKKTCTLPASSLDGFIVEDHIELSGNEDFYHPAPSVLATSGVESRGIPCLLSRPLPDSDSPVLKGPPHPVLNRNKILPSHEGGSPLFPTSRGTPTQVARPHVSSRSNAMLATMEPSSRAQIQCPPSIGARYESPILVLSDSSSDGEFESLLSRIRGSMGSNRKPGDQSVSGCLVSSQAAGNGGTKPTMGASKNKDKESSRLLPRKQPVQRDERGPLAVAPRCPVTLPTRPHSTPAQKKPGRDNKGTRPASDVATEFKPMVSGASEDDRTGRLCTFPGCFLTEMVSQSSLSVRHFRQVRQDITVRLYCLYNDSVFEGKLPDDMPVTWNRRLRKTAGHCISTLQFGKDRSRCARIELSEKVCDTADRLRDTLIHEMCHAASWVLHGIRDGHGQMWQLFARNACLVHPELPPITRCHSYGIRYKFNYRCTSCQKSIGRHSKSLDVNRFDCGLCGGSLRLESPGGTPCHAAPLTPFAQFVKDKYAETRKANFGKGHGEAMRLLSEAFSSKLRLQSGESCS
uniref:germ cell nuclear acidic protein-like n=1 Tax=Myxine glutinosa TaxID=7769 RepID=UPI00358FC84D